MTAFFVVVPIQISFAMILVDQFIDLSNTLFGLLVDILEKTQAVKDKRGERPALAFCIGFQLVTPALGDLELYDILIILAVLIGGSHFVFPLFQKLTDTAKFLRRVFGVK